MNVKAAERSSVFTLDPGAQLAEASPNAPTRPSALTVSVIIVNFNGRHSILRCLDTLYHSLDFDQIIVIDNASTDGSADLVAAHFPDVHLVRSQTNHGFGAACNLGAQLAQGEYFVFLNPDVYIQEGAISALVAPLQHDPMIGLTTAKILLNQMDAAKAIINACGNAIHVTGLTLCRGLGKPPTAFSEMEEVDAISGAAFAVRASVFRALQGFDEDFFLFMEDTDLSLRVRLSGLRCILVPSSIVLHDYSLRLGRSKVFYQERNRYLMLFKCLRWRTLLALTPTLLLAEVVTWGFVILRDPYASRDKVRAYRWILRHWARVQRKRQITQGLRRVGDRELLRHTTSRLDFSQAVNATTDERKRSLAGRIEHMAAVGARLLFDPAFFILRQFTRLVVNGVKG